MSPSSIPSRVPESPPATRPAAPALPPTAGGGSAEAPLRTYLANLGGLLILGVAASAWILFYTDWFPVVGGLLGLGGLFAWLAFVTNILREERKKEIQLAFERAFLGRTWMVIAMLALLAALALGVANRGTLVVDSLREDGANLVTITDLANPARIAVAEVIPSRSERKWSLPTAYFGRRTYRVKVPGLPSAVVTAQAWRRTRVDIPDVFAQRPILLVRPSDTLTGKAGAESDAYELRVELAGGPSTTLQPYAGQTVWIGADEDVTVPDSVRQRWTLELQREQVRQQREDPTAPVGLAPEALVLRWLTPRAVLPDLLLKPGDRVTIVVRHRSNQQHGREYVVLSPTRTGEFLQEVRIDEGS